MSEAFKFDPIETEMIARMFKQRMSARQIAQATGRPLADIINYINAVLSARAIKHKAEKIAAPKIIPSPKERAKDRKTLRRYEDPMAAVEGSQMLLEALHKYFQKHRGTNP